MMNGATLAGTGSEIPPPDLPWKSRLARGVEVLPAPKGLRIVNRANGGELKVSEELLPMFRTLRAAVTIAQCFSAQSLWDAEVFSRFVRFLSRNDYVIVAAVETLIRPLRRIAFPTERINTAVENAGNC